MSLNPKGTSLRSEPARGIDLQERDLTPLCKPLTATGWILFETLFFVATLGFFLLGTHIHVVKLWRKKLHDLEEKRDTYDGIRKWNLKDTQTPY